MDRFISGGNERRPMTSISSLKIHALHSIPFQKKVSNPGTQGTTDGLKQSGQKILSFAPIS